MPGPILPRRYVGPNENYTDSTNIKKRRQQTVGMGCTNLDSGLTSGGVSVSPFHFNARHDSTFSLAGKPLRKPPPIAEVAAGKTSSLLAPPHRTIVCLSSATSSFKNTQLTASYLSFYKDQLTNPFTSSTALRHSLVLGNNTPLRYRPASTLYELCSSPRVAGSVSLKNE